MAGCRIPPHEMPNYTFERLRDELQKAQDSGESKETTDYISNLKSAISHKPRGLWILHDKIDTYIKLYTDKTPAERIGLLPDSWNSWFDYGLSYLWLFKTNQKYASRINNILNKLRQCDTNKLIHINVTDIKATLKELDTVYTDMHQANIKKGEIIDMLRECFKLYYFQPTVEWVENKKVIKAGYS